MFDWDDQELANIIWGEGSEADDQIVQYPENTGKDDLPDYGDNGKKKLTARDTKAAEENTSTSKSFSDGGKQESNSGVSGLRAMGAQHDLPSFSASRADGDPIAKKTQLDIGLEISQNQHDDKELGELVGNSWANIGGFDDLDRIFSNDDLDGQTSLGTRDELWSSSKDLIGGASKSSSQALGSTSWDFNAMGNTASHFEINSEYLLDEDRSVLPGSRKTDLISSYSERNFDERVQQEEYAVGTAGLLNKKTALGMTAKTALESHIGTENAGTSKKSADKENWSSGQSKHFVKMEKLTGSRLVRDMYDGCPSPTANVPQFDGHCPPGSVQNYPASVHHRQQLPRGSRSMVYQHFSNPCTSTYAYGDFTQQYSATHMVNPTDAEHLPMLSHSEARTGNVIAVNKPTKTSTKPVKMTPREKIEKLRRRQQMRAMLAIQLQQQQLGQQVSSVDNSVSQNCQEDQIHNVDKADFEADEGLSTLPCYDPGSPNKKDDSSAISDAEDYSVEDTVLYQLQDIIGRLDLKIRLCIRDSLYRLAQNAMQRSYTSDTSSTNRTSMYEHGSVKEETSSRDRFARKMQVETETNQIDRIVAHLLFHRPFKLSSKHADTPESSTSTKVSTEQKSADPNSMVMGFLAKSSENEYNLSPHDSKTSCPFVDSCEEDILSDIPQRDTRNNPQMNQNMVEHKG